MVMIEKKRHACAHERKNVNANHIGKHLHLTGASLHLKHRVHMEAATSMKGDVGLSSQQLFITNEDLLQELSTLQRSPVFRDPPMSPSCESIHSETILRRCEILAVSRKEAGLKIGSSNNIENAPFTTYQSKNYAKQESKRGSLEKKIRRKRVKVLALNSSKSARSTGLSARGSCSLQSPKALASAKHGASLPSAKGFHLLDIGGPPGNECRAPWNSERVYTKAIQVSAFQDSEHIELCFPEESLPGANPAMNVPDTADMLYTSCRKEDLGAPTSLSIKYAPKSLRDIIGQHLVTQALTNALSKGRVAPMYIFYGPGGTGKTSCAKLFALALNCLSRGDRPCGTCRLCSAQISGKLSPIKEIKAGKAYRVKEIVSLMKEISWSSSFLYKVCIVDECQTLSAKVWNSLLKGTKAASERTVFIFNTLSIEHIPHAVVSRCQKFHFAKIKESDITDKLQMIALQENLDADTEAIRLIASACNGSLYDAELMLDHFSLLGKRVQVPVVQDLVGLISDSTLMELLDSALSANIVHTVQSLKAFHESGVEPLNLTSQLASLITRILAGGYRVPKRKLKSRFFQSKELTKDNMQRLRQALKVLSEAEKQLRNSSGGMTWLIAALLQFSPDRSYIASSCPAASLTQSPLERSDNVSGIPKGLENPGETEKQTHMHFQSRPIVSVNALTNSSTTLTLNSSFQHSETPSSPKLSQWRERSKSMSHDNPEIKSTKRDDLEQVWQRVLDAINSNNLKCFLRAQGKLVSISLQKDFKEALLEFHHLEHLSRVQRSKASILHAFQATLGHRVKVKVHLVSRATEHRTKQNSSQHEAANLNVVQLDTVMCGSGTRNIQLKTSEGSIEQNHQKTELKDLYEPHMVYDTISKLVNSSQKISYDERLQIVSAENIDVSGLPNGIKCTPHNAHMHVWSQGSCSSLDNGRNLGYVLKQAEGRLEGYSLDYRTNTASRRDSTHHMYANASQNRSSALAAGKLQEENLILSFGRLFERHQGKRHRKFRQGKYGTGPPFLVFFPLNIMGFCRGWGQGIAGPGAVPCCRPHVARRMEPASKGTVCREATNNACGLGECFEPCSKHSKFFLGLIPCASVSRSHGAS